MPRTMDLPDYDRYFEDGRRLETPGEPGSPVFLRIHAIGRVTIESGRLVAGDPLMLASDAPGFTAEVPSGAHPVRLCVVEYHKRGKRYDERVALARVDFRAGPVARWELALLPGQSTKKLARDQYFGYPVESGAAAFLDEETAQSVGAQHELDEAFGKRIFAALDANYRDTWSWAEVPLPGDPDRRALVFSAGDGEGTYPTFMGFDASNRIAAALTDFLLIQYAP